ncbi:MAG: response regulator [Bacteroidetes bacterium]|nr:response regulator [Bacteroidota bacterium]
MKHKILLVDDRPENLYSLESMLMEDDRIIFKANSGDEALKIAFQEDLSLVLLDVQMPEMDGFEWPTC